MNNCIDMCMTHSENFLSHQRRYSCSRFHQGIQTVHPAIHLATESCAHGSTNILVSPFESIAKAMIRAGKEGLEGVKDVAKNSQLPDKILCYLDFMHPPAHNKTGSKPASDSCLLKVQPRLVASMDGWDRDLECRSGRWV